MRLLTEKKFVIYSFSVFMHHKGQKTLTGAYKTWYNIDVW